MHIRWPWWYLHHSILAAHHHWTWFGFHLFHLFQYILCDILFLYNTIARYLLYLTHLWLIDFTPLILVELCDANEKGRHAGDTPTQRRRYISPILMLGSSIVAHPWISSSIQGDPAKVSANRSRTVYRWTAAGSTSVPIAWQEHDLIKCLKKDFRLDTCLLKG